MNYKVLDIREFHTASHGSSTGAMLRIYKDSYLIVICEDINTHKRARFEFSLDNKSSAGDVELIVPGDIIEIDRLTKEVHIM